MQHAAKGKLSLHALFGVLHRFTAKSAKPRGAWWLSGVVRDPSDPAWTLPERLLAHASAEHAAGRAEGAAAQWEVLERMVRSHAGVLSAVTHL